MKFISKNKTLKRKEIILLSTGLTIIVLISVLLIVLFSRHNHSFGEWEKVRDASCTRYGLERRYCECGEVQEKKHDMIPHSESDWIYNEEKNQLNTICTVCEKVLNVNSLENHTHSWGEFVTKKEATCTQNGVNVRKCNCGAENTISIAATGHRFGEWITKIPAKCEIDGSAERICSNCQEIEVDVISALSHTMGDYIIVNNEKQFLCIYCDCVLLVEALTVSEHLDIQNNVLIGIGTCETTEIVAPSTIHTVGKYAFEYQSITGFVLSDTVISIEEKAFYQCSELKNIHLGSSITSIGSKAFFKCTSITKITLPESLSSLGEYAFYNCEGLTTIYIGSNIRKLNMKVFGDCINLTSIHYNGSMEEWNAIEKDEEWDLGTADYTVYCTDGNIQK